MTHEEFLEMDGQRVQILEYPDPGFVGKIGILIYDSLGWNIELESPVEDTYSVGVGDKSILKSLGDKRFSYFDGEVCEEKGFTLKMKDGTIEWVSDYKLFDANGHEPDDYTNADFSDFETLVEVEAAPNGGIEHSYGRSFLCSAVEDIGQIKK